MAKAIRQNRTFSLEKEVLEAIEKTKGRRSASECANDLLKSALAQQQDAALEREAADFFASEVQDLREREARVSATIRSIARD